MRTILLICLLLTSCTSTLGSKCTGWVYDREHFEYPSGVTEKVVTYKCYKFKSTPSHF